MTMDAAHHTSTFRGCVAQDLSVTVPGKDWHAGYLEAVTRLLDSRVSAKQPVRRRGELCQNLDIRVCCLGRTCCLPDRFTWFELSKPKLKVTHCRRQMLSKTTSWEHGCDLQVRDGSNWERK